MWYRASEIVDYLQCTEHLKAKRNKRRPKTTWRRTEERELREFNYTGVIFIRWVGTGRVGEDVCMNYTGVIFIRWVWTGRVGEDLSLLSWNDGQQASKVVDGYFSWYNKSTYLLLFFAGSTFPTKTFATISWPVDNRNSQGSTKNSEEASRIHSPQSVLLTRKADLMH